MFFELTMLSSARFTIHFFPPHTHTQIVQVFRTKISRILYFSRSPFRRLTTCHNNSKKNIYFFAMFLLTTTSLIQNVLLANHIQFNLCALLAAQMYSARAENKQTSLGVNAIETNLFWFSHSVFLCTWVWMKNSAILMKTLSKIQKTAHKFVRLQ